MPRAGRERGSMDHNTVIGARVKRLRTEKKMTLRELGERAGLSVGFLSQLERGISNIAIDTLASLADILDVPLSSFLEPEEAESRSPVMRRHEARPQEVSAHIYQYIMTHDKAGAGLLPRVYELMPFYGPDNRIETYSHEGEEIIYMLEGILTVYLGGIVYELYPGDCMQFASAREHNWINQTSRMVRFLVVNSPNPLRRIAEDA